MADDLIPKPEADESGDEASADKNSGQKRPKETKKNRSPRNRNGFKKTKTVIFGIFLVAIESLGIGLWQIADGLTGNVCIFTHWLSLVCIFAGPIPAVYEVVKRKWRFAFWAVNVVIWLVIAVIAAVIWRPTVGIKHTPHITFFLNTTEEITPSFDVKFKNKIPLTNWFLFSEKKGMFSKPNDPVGVVCIPAYGYGTPGYLPPVWMNFIIESQEYAENVRIGISLPANWLCVVGPDWKRGDRLTPDGSGLSKFETWVIDLPVLYANSPTALPAICARKPPITAHDIESTFCSISTQVKGWPDEMLMFHSCFFRMDTTNFVSIPQITSISGTNNFSLYLIRFQSKENPK